MSRAKVPVMRRPLNVTGNHITFEYDGLTYYARTGNTTTAVTCPTYASIPAGVRFTIDNSNGSGSLTLTPVTGTAMVVTAGKVYECYITAAGTLKAGELGAHPT